MEIASTSGFSPFSVCNAPLVLVISQTAIPEGVVCLSEGREGISGFRRKRHRLSQTAMARPVVLFFIEEEIKKEMH